MPDDGESTNSRRGRKPTSEQVASGFIIPTWVKPDTPLPHGEPQSLKTWTEPVSYRNPAVNKLPGTYVAFVGAGQTGSSRPEWQRTKARGWAALTLESDHNTQWSHPRELVRLRESIADAKP